MASSKKLAVLAIVNLSLLTFSCQRGTFDGVGGVAPAPDASTHGAAGVATLREVKAEVSHRRAQELVWNPAAEGAGLSNYDSVRTGPASGAILRFENQTSVRLQERTLMIVLAREEETRSVVALPRGKVDGRLPADSEQPLQLTVRTTRGWITASNRGEDGRPAEVRFAAEVQPDGAVVVRNEAAPIQLVSQTGTQRIDRQQELALKAQPGGRSGEDLEAFRAPPPLAAADIQLRSHSGAPVDVFKLLEPAHKAVVTTERIRVAGEIKGRLKVYLNGEDIPVREDGTFSREVPLNRGLNLLTFQVVGPREVDVRMITREVTRK